MAYIPWWQRMSPPTFAERFELGGVAGRLPFAKGVSGGWWGDWELNYKDQMTFEEYKKALDMEEQMTKLGVKPHIVFESTCAPKKAITGKVVI